MIRTKPDSDADFVLVLATLGAPERRRLRARRARDAPPEPGPTPVTTTRATVIDTIALSDEASAKAKLASIDGDEAAASAAKVVNLALQAQRVATGDPYLREVHRDQALVIRVGYGAGEDVADGRWIEARDVPPPKRKGRSAALSPQERLAALLGLRETPLACEELTLRAQADVTAGRYREAAIQLRAALETALAELADDASIANRVADLRERAAAVEEIAQASLAGPFPLDRLDDLSQALNRLEAALRAHTA